ncbi:MAG: 50S ribosomal protein L30 [Holosporales bacterium]|jgi:ribosomal protein L30/L7E|nr:50S ribosomal protein L30 [Holosporales bacterium]
MVNEEDIVSGVATEGAGSDGAGAGASVEVEAEASEAEPAAEVEAEVSDAGIGEGESAAKVEVEAETSVGVGASASKAALPKSAAKVAKKRRPARVWAGEAAENIVVEQYSSTIRRPRRQILQVRSLGLGRIGKRNTLPAIPPVVALVERLKHLVRVIGND